MRSATGRWVSGDDFFDREVDLENITRIVRQLYPRRVLHEAAGHAE